MWAPRPRGASGATGHRLLLMKSGNPGLFIWTTEGNRLSARDGVSWTPGDAVAVPISRNDDMDTEGIKKEVITVRNELTQEGRDIGGR